MLHVLFNPDDFRHVYVYEGDDFPLIVLHFEHLQPETPAWPFKDAKENLKKRKSGFKAAPQAEKFDRDMRDQVVADSLAPKRRKPSARERNRETTRREKEANAVKRAARHPVPQPPPSTHRTDTASVAPLPSVLPVSPMLDDVAPLPWLDRNSGDMLI